MADTPLFTGAAALAGANAVGISIANATVPTIGKIRLYDGTLIPDSGTDAATLIAAETTLVGYPVGGYHLTGFANAVFAPLGGAVITSNLVSVAYSSGAAVTIGGYWVEDSTGLVREVFVYDPQRTLGVIGNGWPIVVQLGYGANAS